MGIRENIALVDIVVKHGITVDQMGLLYDAMSRTWSQIYYDIAQCFEDEAELQSCYDDEAAMIAENTLDADRVTTFCGDMDLGFVYRNLDRSRRGNVIEMGEDIWRAKLLLPVV